MANLNPTNPSNLICLLGNHQISAPTLWCELITLSHFCLINTDLYKANPHQDTIILAVHLLNLYVPMDVYLRIRAHVWRYITPS